MDVSVTTRDLAGALSRVDPPPNALVWLDARVQGESAIVLRYRTIHGYTRESRIADSFAHRAGSIGLEAHTLARIVQGGDMDPGRLRLCIGKQDTETATVLVDHEEDGSHYTLDTTLRRTPDPIEVPTGPAAWTGPDRGAAAHLGRSNEPIGRTDLAGNDAGRDAEDQRAQRRNTNEAHRTGRKECKPMGLSRPHHRGPQLRRLARRGADETVDRSVATTGVDRSTGERHGEPVRTGSQREPPTRRNHQGKIAGTGPDRSIVGSPGAAGRNRRRVRNHALEARRDTTAPRCESDRSHTRTRRAFALEVQDRRARQSGRRPGGTGGTTDGALPAPGPDRGQGPMRHRSNDQPRARTRRMTRSETHPYCISRRTTRSYPRQRRGRPDKKNPCTPSTTRGH